MLSTLGLDSMDELIEAVIPSALRSTRPLTLPAQRTEHEVVDHLRDLAAKNQVLRSYLGMGYYGTHTPMVIQRNVLENPGWYTAYTPYQAEIAQGRLEALVVFQMVVQDLTGMDISNASLLDEATAAAEAMAMCARLYRGKARTFFVSDACHPQTIEVVRTRAEALGFEVLVGDQRVRELDTPVFGAILQYPATDGRMDDLKALCGALHAQKARVAVATDLLALTLIQPPSEFGVDIVVGSSQRLGVPMGFGGPHAAFLATSSRHQRKMPGRIIGVSRDAEGLPALRMALQTREQHIRRDKATSNVCTAQVLLAVMAAFYAVYHGPEGLKAIAERIRLRTSELVAGLRAGGFEVSTEAWFDTVRVETGDRTDAVIAAALARGINLRPFDGAVGVSFDETVEPSDVVDVLAAFGCSAVPGTTSPSLPEAFARTSAFFTHPVFQRYRSETEMLRYIHRLQSRDLSLTAAMIPLGSCTMKLNATAEMVPITFAGFAGMHPFVPADQAQGYHELIGGLSDWLAEITGFAAISMQPNAGSQGEYAGLLVIRQYHEAQGDGHRKICLIPRSAHGTNPASAVMAGMKVIEVACDDDGNIDVADLEARAVEHADQLAALMVTYPSTHGVFEESISQICDIVHQHGGQVYMDGANLNAMVGLCRPGELGADVCHLNLHKTFCIPHGGGGPGMGPIGVGAHLIPHLPGHPVVPTGGDLGPISAAPFGSPAILPISWAYIALMGPEGLTLASKTAILSANYIATRLGDHFPVLYSGVNGRVAHECILDVRSFKESAGVEVDDIAKRLMDYGFHGPTMSWPVAGTLMVEPTESEALVEVDRFCDAMIAIREEIRAIEEGRADPQDNVLKGAPHTALVVTADDWSRAYGRQQAAYPTAFTRRSKFWPTVSRLDNVWGDRNLCTVLPNDEAV
jgi:glycine dehydrogenase